MKHKLTKRNARKVLEVVDAGLVSGQGEVQRIKANALNPQTRSKYATYDALDKVLRPIYIRHGFALSFGTADSSLSEHVRIVADVSHKEGHSKRYQIDMPADGKGARGGDVMTKTHAVGAGVSYGMRYLLVARKKERRSQRVLLLLLMLLLLLLLMLMLLLLLLRNVTAF